MRIIFSTDQTYLHGGIEKVMAEKANYFADVLGYEVIILTSEQKHRNACYILSEKIKQLDLGINYNRSKSFFSIENLLKIPKHFLSLKNKYKMLNPDFVIVSNFGFDFYMTPFINRGSKKIKEFHSSRFFEHKIRSTSLSVLTRLRYKITDWIESLYDRIIVLNPEEITFYKSSKISVISNPVTLPTTIANLKNKKVIAAGRINQVKGFDKLIESWIKVHNIFPDWELHIYGEDYLGTKNELQKLIIQYHLEKVIFFRGVTTDSIKTFSEYSIYALSSQTECYPMVLLEALSVGLPVVSFDCPTGPRHILTHLEDGILVENQKPEALSSGLIQLIENEELRKEYGSNAKKNSHRFTAEKIMLQWASLFQEMK
ncbi:hypothetical protein ASG01_12640 [Chryseobacterium sp. Leaf180]|uniref:glycosyltransferase family 4 protein n=1 Tax=Chryseobacterium sp. Leaf180 TaxID=1736289 RepID=UPI0006F7F977|nr:glycosyltransferase family 4 protein [Chryseobacterium sp. Leaf180]KQR91847.1 hypothetical protein ASG01_12640 [Chryseobacterium sp. Leaf180]